jgi:hypothetical protein
MIAAQGRYDARIIISPMVGVPSPTMHKISSPVVGVPLPTMHSIHLNSKCIYDQ